MKKSLIVVISSFILIIGIFFRPVFLQRLLPLPADTIVGLYHPFRDMYRNEYPNGIPYKNALITDPVRQQYPWRFLSVEALQKVTLPLWNPYAMAGTPLLATMQSAPLYPLNIIFFLLPFSTAWSLLVILQPLLAALFLYLYLRCFAIDKRAAFIAGLTFAFSGFMTAWMEWNTIGHTALWLPVILLVKEKLLQRWSRLWVVLLFFAEVSLLFAGHLQTWFYAFLISNVYLLGRIVYIAYNRNNKKHGLLMTIISLYKPFFLLGIGMFILTVVQWFPTAQFILHSARSVDVHEWNKPGWFIPWQHVVQFLAPDFFGNPTTLNYWGVWNYAEFVGYIGILSLLFAFYALFVRRDKKTLFFGSIFFLSLIFSLPTVLAHIPYVLRIPFVWTSQPTRLLFVTDLSLAVLAGLGCDTFLKKRKYMLWPSILLLASFSLLWLTLLFIKPDIITATDLQTATRNMYFPTLLFFLSLGSVSIYQYSKNATVRNVLMIMFVLILAADLLRFFTKFTPFTDQKYVYPSTQTTEYLQRQHGNFRIMATDERILPPNFTSMYHIQSVDGYDPLYIQRYGELIIASERKKPDISTPFGFNRIITPKNYDSSIIDLLGVQYVLSLSDIASTKLEKVFQEGDTRVYKNKQALPRAFFVQSTLVASNKQDAIEKVMSSAVNLRTTAVIESEGTLDVNELPKIWQKGEANIIHYSANKIRIQTNVKSGQGFLVLTDTYYPMWKAKVYNESNGKIFETRIIRTNYNFRGVIVPQGNNIVEFSTSVFPSLL